MNFPFPSFDWTTLGADPEVAIFTNDGSFVRAKNVLKEQSNRLEVDGMFAELHPGAVTCREILTRNIRDCLSTLFRNIPDMMASNVSVVEVPKKDLENATDDEVILGCEPDISAYGGSIQKIDVGDPRKLRMRTGGGHMHFGWNCRNISNVAAIRNGHYVYANDYKELAGDIIQTMDYLCGLPCVLIDKGSGPAERRKLYGKAGSYRIQPHGIEYRVLSNFWLRHFSLVSLVFLFGRLALIVATEYPDLMEKISSEIPASDVQAIINENNEQGAKEAIKHIIPYINLLTNYPAIPYLMFLDKHGLDDIFPKDLATAWGVSKYETIDTNRTRVGSVNNRWWGGNIGDGFQTFIRCHNFPNEWKDEIRGLVREYK